MFASRATIKSRLGRLSFGVLTGFGSFASVCERLKAYPDVPCWTMFFTILPFLLVVAAWSVAVLPLSLAIAAIGDIL